MQCGEYARKEFTELAGGNGIKLSMNSNELSYSMGLFLFREGVS